jgi:hypothetical protein
LVEKNENTNPDHRDIHRTLCSLHRLKRVQSGTWNIQYPSFSKNLFTHKLIKNFQLQKIICEEIKARGETVRTESTGKRIGWKKEILNFLKVNRLVS